MKAIVITTPENGKDWDSTRKETDLSKPGNGKWLLSHLKWAIENRQTVVIQAAR
jgi:hypothetical protein